MTARKVTRIRPLAFVAAVHPKAPEARLIDRIDDQRQELFRAERMCRMLAVLADQELEDEDIEQSSAGMQETLVVIAEIIDSAAASLDSRVLMAPEVDPARSKEAS